MKVIGKYHVNNRFFPSRTKYHFKCSNITIRIQSKIKNHNFHKSNIKVLGSYNPEFMCSEKDFYDDKHLKASCLKFLFNKLYVN